ncbi:hypothetical protein JCM10213_000821 [Rhodosporidiobolus nylandii]
MLDRLPLELLDHILHFAAPLDYTPDLYKERRATLRSCCLVSRTMRELAQPMLPEVFAARTKKDVQMLETDGRGKQVKLLACNGEHWIRESKDEPGWQRGTMAACPHVRDLRLFGADLNLELLAPLSALRRLVLVDGRIGLTNAETTLSKLEELSMDATHMDSVGFGVLLRTHCLPALQSLAVTGLDPNDGAAFSSAISSGFFDSVKHIVLDAYDLAQLPPSFPLPDPSRVLLTTSHFPSPEEFTLSFKPTHLALSPSATLEDVLTNSGLPDAIRSFLPVLSLHTTIRNLGVPDFLHPSRSLAGELASLRRELLKACADNKIRVVWTADRTMWDSLVRSEFRRVLAEEAPGR